MENTELEWMNERVPRLPKYNFFYKIACFLTGRARRKMTYKELYMIFKRLNENPFDNDRQSNERIKEYAFLQVLVVYKFLNNRLPNGVSLKNGV